MLFDLLILLLGVVLTAGTFIFVSAKFSLVALDQAIAEKRATQGDPQTKAVLTATRTLLTQLFGTQIGITLTTILLGYATQSTLADLLSKGLVSTGLVYALASGAAAIIAAIVISVLSTLFGELVPKNFALTHPLKTARLVAAFQTLLTSAVKPLVLVLNGTADGVLRPMSIEPQEKISSARSASELEAMLHYSAQEGTIGTSTASLLMNAIHISDLTAVDIITDRGRIRILESTATATDVVALSHESDHSHFPVIDDDLDNIIGLVSLGHAIAVPFERRAEVPAVSSSLLAEAPSVSETASIGPLMVQLHDEGLQMAVVVDEYGGVSGVVTLEGIIEEIVGEMSDEHDGHRRGIRTRSDERILVPGLLRPDKLAERARVTLPEDGVYGTLADLVMAELGCVAQVGDVMVVEEYTLGVVQMQGRRITQIAIAPPEVAEEEEVEL